MEDDAGRRQDYPRRSILGLWGRGTGSFLWQIQTEPTHVRVVS